MQGLCPRETLFAIEVYSSTCRPTYFAAIRESRGRRQSCKHVHEDKSLNKKEAYRQLVDEAIARWIFNTMQSFDDGQDDTDLSSHEIRPAGGIRQANSTTLGGRLPPGGKYPANLLDLR